MAFKVKAIIEIPKKSNVKYEVVDNKLVVDRILFKDFVYPFNYGYIPQTLDYDGDPLDVLIIGDFSIAPLTHVDVRIVGAMKMIDEGETDTKLIGYIGDDPNHKNEKNIQDVKPQSLEEIKYFFSNYKKYKNSVIIIDGFEDVDYAEKELKVTLDLFTKFKELDKKHAILEMKKLYPNKYRN